MITSIPRLDAAGSIGSSASGIYLGKNVLMGPSKPLVERSNVRFHFLAKLESGGVKLVDPLVGRRFSDVAKRYLSGFLKYGSKPFQSHPGFPSFDITGFMNE